MKTRAKKTVSARVQEHMDDAQDLVSATADVAEETFTAARERLDSALDAARAYSREMQRKAVAAGKLMDATFHARPYQALGLAVGLGVLLGLMLRRRR
jgi:ElaB/YqjD/DUF883 family membrane-anchored ribosome-binding protein